MDFHYPIRSAEGKAFSRPDEVYRLLAKEKHGRWLAGENGMWHGGIHVSRDAVPWSVLTKDNRDNAVPLSCIADGEVVAWRLNQDYHTASLGDAQLQYSNAFMLIRSIHKPDDNASTWLTFYTLYMQLAPLSCYPMCSVYQVTAKGNGLKMRSFIGGEKTNQAAPGVISDNRLKTGDKVLIERQETFLLRGHQEVFGLAQKIKNGVPQGKKFWTSVRPEFVESQGELYVGLPDWMSKAVEQQAFDSVVTPSQPIAIKAGDAVGYLARNDTANEKGELTTDWFTHIEVISNDKNMPAFLGNPGKLKSGKQYIVVKDNQPLYSCEEKGEKRLFNPMNVMTQEDAGKIIAREETHSWKDDTGITWFQLRAHTWVRQDSVNEITQHDLVKLKFTALEQEPTKDVQHSLAEKWIGQAFRSLCDDLPFKRDLACRSLYDYYSRMADVFERYKEGKIAAEDMAGYGNSILRGLQQRNSKAEALLRRLVVKHESEWYGGGKHPRWQTYLESLSPEGQESAKKWLDDHEWMSQVPIFNRDEPVWHFHPVEFILYIKNGYIRKRRDYNLGTLSSKYETGGRGARTISGGVGDAGGVSYGSYQMTSKTTRKINGEIKEIIGGTVKIFVSDGSFKWRNEFDKLTPGSSGFTSKWKELVDKYPSEFMSYEHHFIKETHFDKLISHTFDETGIDLRYHSHTINDVAWSTAVHNGSRTYVIINAIKSLKIECSETKEYDQELIIAIYNERGKENLDGSLVYFSKNSSNVQDGIRKRFISEKKEALERLKNETDY